MTNNRVRHSHEDEHEPADAGLVIRPIHADTLDAYLQQHFDETSCECDYDFDDADVDADFVNPPDDDDSSFDVPSVSHALKKRLQDKTR